jgi:hypothetical protein
MVMDFGKVIGMTFLTFILLSYLSFIAEWNFFMFVRMIRFFHYIDLSLEYWVFLDRYIFNGIL